MHDRPASARLLAALLVLGATLAGGGKSLPAGESHSPVATVAGVGALASGLATKNTTRLGGANPIGDAAAVALAVNPGLTPATRPAAVVLVNESDWAAALAASALASAPLGAPLLYSEGNTLPAISAEALRAMRPVGSPLLDGTQVIEIGTSAAPAGDRTRSLAAAPAGDAASGAGTTGGAGATPGQADKTGPSAGGAVSEPDSPAAAASAALAARIERLVATAHGGPPRRVIVIGADGPRALAMPAAGLAAETGAPILPVDANRIPTATRRVLAGLRRPAIYAVGPPAAVGTAVLAQLARFGAVRRIYPGPGTPASLAAHAGSKATGGTSEAVANAIAVARYSHGSFGWDIDEPGHGLVFVNASRPLDAPAAAPLSASGDFGPLLLLDASSSPAPGSTAGTSIPPELTTYLGDIKPAY